MASNSSQPDGPLAEALVRVNELQEKLTICRRELEQAKEEASASAALLQGARDELRFFVYAASHDLQAPLRTLTNYAQLLQRESSQTPQAKEYMQFIIDGASQMSALVTSLLTYSQTGNTPRIAIIGANEPLQMALFKLAGRIRETGADVKVGELVEISADREQITAVFEHLILNALKYRGENAPKIQISGEQSAEFLKIAVQDNGEGIATEHQEKVFEPFRRLHGKEIPGSGLGLAICRKIVLAHGGKIWVESDGRTGSTFHFTIPI